MLEFILFMACTVLSLKIIIFFTNIYEFSKAKTAISLEETRIEEGILGIEDIYALSPREFEVWCGYFLKELGYRDIKVTKIGPDGGKDIICRKDEDPVYVECKRYYYGMSAPNVVDENTVKKLVGVMISDDIRQGIIITTGKVTKDALDFAKSVSGTLSLRIIDGKELVSIFNEIDNDRIDYGELIENLALR